ncbi:hypothetical protein D3C73_1079490 [compost metagenome]
MSGIEQCHNQERHEYPGVPVQLKLLLGLHTGCAGCSRTFHEAQHQYGIEDKDHGSPGKNPLESVILKNNRTNQRACDEAQREHGAEGGIGKSMVGAAAGIDRLSRTGEQLRHGRRTKCGKHGHIDQQRIEVMNK